MPIDLGNLRDLSHTRIFSFFLLRIRNPLVYFTGTYTGAKITQITHPYLPSHRELYLLYELELEIRRSHLIIHRH